MKAHRMLARLVVALVYLALLSAIVESEQPSHTDKKQAPPAATNEALNNVGANPALDIERLKTANQAAPGTALAQLDARTVEQTNFVKDILDRLHALDADIGKLIFNSTSMYAPNDEGIIIGVEPKQGGSQPGGEKFTEVLTDLDALQDEVGVLINNATRTRQYNILIRLRPINNILYRIRHNLHLMRNSLVAINTVSRLEKIGNSVLDSTLSAFMRPDANLNDEIGDDGNYDFNLDRPQDLPAASADRALIAQSTTTSTTPAPTSSTTVASPPPASTTTAATTTTTTTTSKPALASTSSAQASTAARASTTRRPTIRPTQRRSNNRQSQRRTTAKPTLAPRVEPLEEQPE